MFILPKDLHILPEAKAVGVLFINCPNCVGLFYATVNESTIYDNNLMTVDADNIEAVSLEKLVRQLAMDLNARRAGAPSCHVFLRGSK